MAEIQHLDEAVEVIGFNGDYPPQRLTIDFKPLIESFHKAVESRGRGLSQDDIEFLRLYSDLFSNEYYNDGTMSAYLTHDPDENLRNTRPDLTNPKVEAIIKECGLKKSDRLLDVGCSYGYYVKSLRDRGIDAEGIDISTYAISHSDSAIRRYVKEITDLSVINNIPDNSYDLLMLKDILEHIPDEILPRYLSSLRAKSQKMLVVVPLVDERGVYINDKDKTDFTHIIRKNKEEWAEIIGGTYTELDGLNQSFKGENKVGTLTAIFEFYS